VTLSLFVLIAEVFSLCKKTWIKNGKPLEIVGQTRGLIERVMGVTDWKYEGLRGIAGKSLPEIDGLELKTLSAGDV
jgi:hypothetical protein